MKIWNKTIDFYSRAKSNKWLNYFANFCRISLALGFIPSGFIKIKGERFASGLSINHPLGHYLEALYQTDFYYTFIGVAQILIAILLLIPRTVVLGAILYFPIILNICVLAYATRFEGTRITNFMLLANLFLLCWHYDHLKFLFLSKKSSTKQLGNDTPISDKFPFIFFTIVVSILIGVIIINQHIFDIRPGNAMIECMNGCPGNKSPNACEIFCNCIHEHGYPLKECLKSYTETIAISK
ncbi:MAG: DoxX family protein [Saprospiraceae bacterium]|nr:DoxX family protein [Saprospiraceae bacterium]